MQNPMKSREHADDEREIVKRCIKRARLRPDNMTPLGWPVVPPVPAIIAISSTGSISSGSSLTPSSQVSNAGAKDWVLSRQTANSSFGSSGKIRSTIDA
jgi:hypothetical protein